MLTSRQRSALFSLPAREADLRRHDTLPPTPKAEGGIAHNLSNEGILWRENALAYAQLATAVDANGQRLCQVQWESGGSAPPSTRAATIAAVAPSGGSGPSSNTCGHYSTVRSPTLSQPGEPPKRRSPPRMRLSSWC